MRSALALLETRILFANDIALATTNDDLAILGQSLDAAANFHIKLQLVRTA